MAVTPFEPPRAAFAMEQRFVGTVFSPSQHERLRRSLELDDQPIVDEYPELADLEVLITGWGAPFLDAAALGRLPRLRAIFHAAGTVKPVVSLEAWKRGILVTSAARANSLPVAEFALASILFAGKGVFPISRAYTSGAEVDLGADVFARIGNVEKTVGIVGASHIGRRVIELLEPFDFTVLLSDPFVRAGDPVLDRARLVPLEQLVHSSDIMSLHAPLLPETTGMISRELLESMPRGATLINTARAALVDQEALVDLAQQERLAAVLDVTDPEPLPADHALRRLPTVFLTPHLAGARGNELHRLGASVISEVEAFISGRPPLFPVNLDALAHSA